MDQNRYRLYLYLFNQMNENLQQSIKQSVNRRLVYEIHFHNPDENPSFSADTKPVSAWSMGWLRHSPKYSIIRSLNEELWAAYAIFKHFKNIENLWV